MPRILVVDDDAQMRRFLSLSLTMLNHEVVEAASGKEAITLASTENPDIIVLDIELPDRDGMEVISNIREWSKVPIIILSSKSEEADKIEALERKVDDFIVKPFHISKLIKKIEVLLKNNAKADDEPISIGNIKVDIEKNEVFFEGKQLKLSKEEMAFLKTLALNYGKVITTKHILRELGAKAVPESLLYIRRLAEDVRKKLGEDAESAKYIIFEPKIGYRLTEPN